MCMPGTASNGINYFHVHNAICIPLSMSNIISYLQHLYVLLATFLPWYSTRILLYFMQLSFSYINASFILIALSSSCCDPHYLPLSPTLQGRGVPAPHGNVIQCWANADVCCYCTTYVSFSDIRHNKVSLNLESWILCVAGGISIYCTELIYSLENE
jgi:hypothetical protein